MPSLRLLAAITSFVLAAVAPVLPAADAPPSDWATQAGNAERNSVMGGSLATRRAQVAWSIGLTAAGTSPAVVDGRIYLTQADGAVVCLDAGTGAQVWRRGLAAPSTMTPVTVAGDRLVFTRFNHAADSQAMALTLDTGATLWSKPVTAQWDSYGSPLVTDGRVICGGGNYSGLYGFDLATGTQLFFNSTLPQVDGWAPSAAQGGVLTWSGGTLRRHAAATGVIERSAALGSGGYTQVNLAAVAGDRVVVTSSAGLHCLQPTTLTPWWTVAAAGFTATAVVCANDVLAIQSGIIQRRALADGSLLASAPDLGLSGITGNPLLVCDDAVLCSKPGQTFLLDRTTLALRQVLPLGGRVVVAEGALYVLDGTTLTRLDLLDATLDPTAVITVHKDGVPVAEGTTVDGEVDVTVTITNAIGQHVQVYGNLLVLSAMDHSEMIPTSPWTLTTRVDTRRFFDGENLFSVHVHPHNDHSQRHTTDFIFGTFTVRMANGRPAASGDQYLPRFRPPTQQVRVLQGPSVEGSSWPILRGTGDLLDDGVVYGVDQFPSQPGPIQIIPHLGTSVLGRARWHRQLPPMGDLSLVDGVDVRPFQTNRPRLARVVYFFTDRAGRANYYAPTILIPALAPTDAAAVPVPLMHGHFLNLHDGAHLVADPSAGFTAWVRVVDPLPHADRYRSMTVWIGNRATAVVPLQPYIDAMPPGATSCTIPVVIPASEISGLLAARDPGESSRAFAMWLDFNQGDHGNQIDTPNMPNAEHVHLNSVRLSTTPWPYGAATVHIESPYAGQAITQPMALRYRTWGDLAGVAGAQVSIDGGPFVAEAGFDGTMTLPTLTRGSHTAVIRLVDAAGQPVAGATTQDSVAFLVPNRAPSGSGEGWRVTVGSALTLAAPGVLANDADPDGDPVTAVLGTPPRQGTVNLAADGGFTYQPTAGFRGVDRFTYRISDGSAVSGEMVVLLTVGSDGRMGVPGPWTTMGNSPSHAGRASGSLNGRVPVQAWVHAPGIGTMLQPVIADGRVSGGVSTYFAAGMHAMSLDLATGVQLWRRDFANGFGLNDPTWDAGTVYLQRGNHSTDTHLWALDAATGTVRWQTPFGAQWERYLAPCVADGRIYINGGGYGGMYGFRQSDGVQQFFTALEQLDEWTPTLLDGRLYSHLLHRLRRHDPLTGVVLATVQLDIGQVDFAETYQMVSGEGVLLVRSAVALTCIDAATLVRRWRVFGENKYIGLPAIADGLAYVPLSGGGLDVRSLVDGTRQRSVAMAALVSQPVVCDDLVLISTASATHALDRATLATRWTVPAGGRLSLGQDHLVVTSNSTSRLTAYRLEATNVAPTAVADALATDEDIPLAIQDAALLANDSDADGNQLSLRIMTAPAYGSLTAISGGRRYQPDADWSGTDTFTYVANDGVADSQPVTVTITVAPVEDAPVPLKPGLFAQFFDYTTALSVIPDLSGRTADVTRTDAQIAYASVSTAWSGLPATMADTFASRHTGWLKVDTAGSYTLFVGSDDGSRVHLDSVLLINNDGLHGMQERSATVTLNAGYHRLAVEFFENGGGAGLELRWQGPGIAKQLVPASALWQDDAVTPPPYVAGLLAEFFDHTTALSVIPDLTGRSPDVSRTDAQIAYASVSTAWNGLPGGMVDTFASRHSGFLKVDVAGSYTLSLSSDDGSRLYLDGSLLVDNDGLHGMREYSATVTLAAGYHPLRVEFFENGGGAGLQFSWSGPGIAKQLVPPSALWRLPAAVTGLPAPWVSTDVGAVGLAGSATGDGDDFTILGSGADIWNNADAFQFVHRPLPGDGELIARVVSLGNTNPWAKAGVMVRASTDAGSVHGMMVLTPANGASFQHRAVTGGSSASATAAGRSAPGWVRIVRGGTNVSGWVSIDGITWTQVGTTISIPLGTNPSVGLAVTAHDNAVRTTAVFDQVVWVPAAGG